MILIRRATAPARSPRPHSTPGGCRVREVQALGTVPASTGRSPPTHVRTGRCFAPGLQRKGSVVPSLGRHVRLDGQRPGRPDDRLASPTGGADHRRPAPPTTKGPPPTSLQVTGPSCGGGWGIRTPEGVTPTRFPSGLDGSWADVGGCVRAGQPGPRTRARRCGRLRLDTSCYQNCYRVPGLSLRRPGECARTWTRGTRPPRRGCCATARRRRAVRGGGPVALRCVGRLG